MPLSANDAPAPAPGNHLLALGAVNAASTLSQTVQIGAMPLLLGLILTERQIDPALIGLVATAPWLTILLLSRAVPALLKRIGLLHSALASALVSTAATLLIGFNSDLLMIFVLNILFGAGTIVRWIACDTWIVAIAPREIRGRAIGVHETLMGLGIAAGPLVLAVTGTAGTPPFLACAALLLLAIPWLAILRPWDRHSVPGTGLRSPNPEGLFHLIPVGLLGAFEAGFVETSSVSLLAVYCTETGYATLAATLMVASFGLGGTLLQVPIGWTGDRIGARAAHRLCAAVILAGAVVIPFSLAQGWLAAGLAFAWGGAIGGMNTLAVMEAGEKTPDHDMAGAMTAIAFSYTLGSITGPLLSGALMQYVSPHGLMIAAASVSVAFLVTASLTRPTQASPGVAAINLTPPRNP